MKLFNMWCFNFVIFSIITLTAFYFDDYKLALGFLAASLCAGVVVFDSFKIDELKKYKVFHDHIKAHFKKEHPDWKVKCKICDKDIDTIVKEERGEA